MCGIIGLKLHSKTTSKFHFEQMEIALSKQNHRGPDNKSIYQTEKIVFGHNRLAIIDTQNRSNQPFTDKDKRYVLVFNGEIYNFKELKLDLEKKGIIFETSSDTEVLFHLLIQQQSSCLELLRGCFAFAFYDTKTDYLLLARDRMGINPLLYSFNDDGILFSSENTTFSCFSYPLSISLQSLNYYFKYTYIPAPYTIYNEVKKLLPGHYLEMKGQEVKLQNYWSPKADQPFSGTYQTAIRELQNKVRFAVHSQLESDVPIGTFLSGGVDSSIVSALVKEVKSDLHTFSVTFGQNKAYDESVFSQKVAKHISSQHHIVALNQNDFKNAFFSILDSFDEPFADSSAIAMWFLSRETAKEVKVSLSGDGADEMFGGYNKHQAYLKQQKWSNWKVNLFAHGNKVFQKVAGKSLQKHAYQLQRFAHLNRLSWPQNYWYLAANIGDNIKEKLLLHLDHTEEYFLNFENNLNNFLLKDQLFVLPNDMLKKVDLMSMRHSLEVRTPFMDKDLVKFANSLPENWKIQNKSGKYILKESFKDLLPNEIFARKKQGFEVPFATWIKSFWNELIPEKWFQQDFIQAQGLFHFTYVQELKNHFFQKQVNTERVMWAYIVFQYWYEKNELNLSKFKN
ncbi:MAG: asparagine synthase (glutamine-hydrolyzing) [Flavobacteriia bacterium]|nr:asparagine synthase (glutamine-hydrolyzing) [Flavobacteriia bacterium]